MEPFVQSVNWCKYSEAGTCKKSGINAALVERHHDLLHRLHAVQENLSFRKTVMEKALNMIVGEKAQEWALDKSSQKDWVLTMSTRLRNICFVVANAERKKKMPSWALKLPWRAGQAVGAAQHAAQHAAQDFIYEYNNELRIGIRYRMDSNGKVTSRETAVKLEPGKGSKGTDPILAVFADGTATPLTDLTCDPLSGLAC